MKRYRANRANMASRVSRVRRFRYHSMKQRNPIPILLGGAIIAGGAALISMIGSWFETKQYETFKSTLPVVVPPPTPKPPSNIITPGPSAVGEVIYGSQVAWKDALEGSMGPATKRDYTSLWIAGLGLAVVLIMRK